MYDMLPYMQLRMYILCVCVGGWVCVCTYVDGCVYVCIYICMYMYISECLCQSRLTAARGQSTLKSYCTLSLQVLHHFTL